MRIAGLGLLVSVVAAAPALADGPAENAASHHAPEAEQASSSFVRVVRDATAQFRDVNVATQPSNGYGLFPGCFSGPQSGAMGVHYVNGALLVDGQLDVHTPEALVYEPQANGALRLVGVEYIVKVADWFKDPTHTGTPMLRANPNDPDEPGQVLQLVDGIPDPKDPPIPGDNGIHTPNRFGLPPFYELHVWAWRDNPQGTFADWNTQVSCDRQ